MTIQRTRHFAYLALLSAMAITLNIVESVYIGSFSFGIRIGLANIIAILTIKLLGVKDTIIVNVMRVMIGSLMRGQIFGSSFWISLGGVILSTIVLIIMDRCKSSILFMSMMCAIAHSVGQVLVVMAFYQQAKIVAILPYLLLGSIPMGFMTGYIAKMVLARIKPLRLDQPMNTDFD